MNDTELNKNGKRLISRAGALCYARNKLMSRENDLLTSKQAIMASSPKSSSMKHRATNSMPFIQAERINAGEDNQNFRFMSPPSDTAFEELAKNVSKSQIEQCESASPTVRRCETRVISFFIRNLKIGPKDTKRIP